jgi:hypothetical protein
MAAFSQGQGFGRVEKRPRFKGAQLSKFDEMDVPTIDEMAYAIRMNGIPPGTRRSRL